MHSEAAAYYHWPTFWVGNRPGDFINVDISMLDDEVFRRQLAVGIDVRVLREGMFIFGFSRYPPGKALGHDAALDYDASALVAIERTRVMNSHLACLHSAIATMQNYSHQRMVINPSDILAVSSFEESWGGAGDLRLLALSTARFPSTYSENIPVSSDWRIQFRNLVVETETLEESFRLLEGVLGHDSGKGALLCDLFNRSCKAYEEHNYSLCLITAWAITENLLQKLWAKYLGDNRQRKFDGSDVHFINKNRKEILLDGRNFGASVVSEILSLNGELPFQTYKEISIVRKSRNDWIHKLEPVSREQSHSSVDLARQMLSLVEGVHLQIALRSSVHG